MENKPNVRIGLLLKLIVAIGVFNAMALMGPTSVSADGKLRRAKKAVHNTPAKPKLTRKPDAKLPQRDGTREAESDHQDSSDHQHSGGSHGRDSDHRDRQRQSAHRHARNEFQHHRPRSRSAGVFLFSATPSCIEPILPPVITYSPVSCDPIVVQQPVPLQTSPSVYQPAIAAPVDSFATSSVPLSQDGFLTDEGLNVDWFDSNTSKFWAAIGSDFDGITSGGLGLLVQSPGSFGLDSSVMTLRESDGDYRDHLWIGDVNLVYEILARGDVRGRVGLGVNWLSDSWGAEAGFNLTAGVDLRLTERLVISAEGDVGNLGDADFFHGRVNLARRLETCELVVGIDHFNFGGAEVNSVFTGLQFRF